MVNRTFFSKDRNCFSITSLRLGKSDISDFYHWKIYDKYQPGILLKYLCGFECGACNSNCEVQNDCVPNIFKESQINYFSKEQ